MWLAVAMGKVEGRGEVTLPSLPPSPLTQSFTSLEGFFNTLRAFEAANTNHCVPDLPSGFAPKRWKGYSKT